MVVPDDLPADQRSLGAAYRAKCGTGIPADIIPCRRSVFDRRKTRFGTLSYAAWHEGKRIYGA